MNMADAFIAADFRALAPHVDSATIWLEQDECLHRLQVGAAAGWFHTAARAIPVACWVYASSGLEMRYASGAAVGRGCGEWM